MSRLGLFGAIARTLVALAVWLVFAIVAAALGVFVLGNFFVNCLGRGGDPDISSDDYICEGWEYTAPLVIVPVIIFGASLLLAAYGLLREGLPRWWSALLIGTVLFAGGLAVGTVWLRWILP